MHPVAIFLLAWLGLAAGAVAQGAVAEFEAASLTPRIDGDLADWSSVGSRLVVAEKSQLIAGNDFWVDQGDLSASFQVAAYSTHLYLAGRITDDHVRLDRNLIALDATDRLELYLGFLVDGDAASMSPEDAPLLFMPAQPTRPWSWAEPGKVPLQQVANQLAGVRIVARSVDPNTCEFEAAVPFHQFPALRPGQRTVGFNLVLRDHDPADGGREVGLSWNGRDPSSLRGLGLLRLPSPGPLASAAPGGALLSGELLVDLPYLLVPLLCLLGLVVLLRAWHVVRPRLPWLRPVLIGGGLLLFVVGWWWPTWCAKSRADGQRADLESRLTSLQSMLGMLEEGTLRSYRGASRDRALMELFAGRSIARQRITSYRSLAQLAPDQFGPPVRTFDDIPVRTYWLPLATDRRESFQFDPPLRGTRLDLLLGRPAAPTFSFASRPVEIPVLELDLDLGGGATRRERMQLDRPFVDGSSLGREFWEVCVVPIVLDRDRDLRAVTIANLRGADLRLVGVSLEGPEPGRIEPLQLGAPSQQGVLTDLRGPYPLDAGLELAPGATTKVVIPPGGESPQRLWFFYHAKYPGVPTANPYARVGEIVLHFGESQKRSLVLEHQASMFYEMAMHNTRAEPPEGSPAAIALSWTDDSQEVRVNLGYPVADLPTDAPLSAIEFRNLAEYRVRFRSVVFVNERAAAPQDPPESPLVRASSPQERMLLPEAIAALRGASITIYRGGRLSESTLPAEARQELLVLPRAVASAESTLQASVATGGSRRLVLYSPLRGDGWDGATLALSVTDPDWIAAARHDSRLGLLFCSLSAPFLLVLLSELLAMAASLRFRLIAVTTVAALAPLGLLSLVLVRVLESGHAVDVEEGMRAAVRSAAQQLEDQKAKVRQSAERWLDDLQKLAGEKVASWNETQLTTAVPEVAAALQQLLNGQLPPEWRGGFLRLDWQPRLGKATTAPVGLAAGDERVAMVEVPARLEPGVFMQQGELILGVRAETAGRGGSFVLTAGRPLDGNLLSSLAPGRDLLLTDVRGYPLRVSSASGKEDDLLLRAKDPATMAQCERSLALGVEQRQPIVHRGNPAVGDFVYGSEVLRDLQDTPRAMLVLAQPDQRATLDLTVGAIPVRAFFLLVAGSLVVLAVFLSFVVSGRISRPIEQLAAGAQALSRGQLDTRVPVDDGGQIGRLTRAFNQMAADLQARLQDLQALNRTMSELAAEHDEATTRDVLHRFCRANTSADAIAIVLADPAGQRLVVHRGGEVEPGALPLAALPMVVLAGAFASVSRGDGLPAPWADLLPGQRSLVGLPLVFGGQARGVVLLGFTRVPPLPVDLELLSTVVAQAAVAFERSQLQRVAVQDPVTGALTPDFFRRRITDEVSVAQQRGRPLAMLAIAFGAGDRRPRGLRRFAAFLREQLPSTSITAHVGGGQFQIALPGQLRERAEATLAALTTAWEELVRQLPENEVENQPPAGVVVAFPAEAPSAEFLFEALRARLEALHTPGASAMESDETLQRAGVTVVSPAMRAVYGDLRRVAPTDIPILLEGETGVGKEVLTNLVHRWSRRAGGPLVRVHCAALSETLLASELFGHEKGAFTGAERRKIGRFEQADGGTLFLDEVGEIPLDVQVKLLRVLQEGEVDRVGGNEPVKVDVRVVAATNRDIARMVAEGRFREDLYYRLQGMVVKVPPLRERKQELSTLVEHFRAEIIAEGHAPVRAWSTDALDELYRHDWPGNIRQLRNTVFRAMVLAPGSVVVARDVLAALSDRAGSGGAATAAPVLASLPVASDDAADPVVVVPRPPVVPAAAGLPTARRIAEPDPAPARALPSGLSPRLLGFLADAVARGTCSTADHMQQRGLSHRTALRDAQQLVQFGLLERVGSRRGAFYRPTPAAGRFLGDLTPPWPTAESSPPASG